MTTINADDLFAGNKPAVSSKLKIHDAGKDSACVSCEG
jgi:hypothetical protein